MVFKGKGKIARNVWAILVALITTNGKAGDSRGDYDWGYFGGFNLEMYHGYYIALRFRCRHLLQLENPYYEEA